MGDLISRSALLESLNDGTINFKISMPESHVDTVRKVLKLCFEQVEKAVNEQPTAYDVEKVVADVMTDCFSMGFDESQAEIIVVDIRNGGKE